MPVENGSKYQHEAWPRRFVLRSQEHVRQHPESYNRKEEEQELGIRFKSTGTGWRYDWQSNGMLKRVIRLDEKVVHFRYDALGRRTAKVFKGTVTRWVWDGNVPLHEWEYKAKVLQQQPAEENEKKKQKLPVEPTEDVTTWVFEEGTFVPAAKIKGGKRYSIVTDYLGTPIQMYDEQGEKTWDCTLDVYGKVATFEGSSLEDCPFRYQGQYEDEETGLYYNRFRYYEPEAGGYISQDPIGLEGGNPTIYGYVFNINAELDLLGLDLHHIIPQEIYKKFKQEIKAAKGYIQNATKRAKDITNLKKIDSTIHGNHPKYSEYVSERLSEIIKEGIDLDKIRALQNELRGHIDDAIKAGIRLNDYFKEGLHKKNKPKVH